MKLSGAYSLLLESGLLMMVYLIRCAQVYLNNKDIKKISLKASTIQPHELLPLKLRF